MSNRSRNNDDRRATPPKVDTMYSLKVDNLTYRTRVEDLRRYFEKFGPIGDIYIPRDQFSRSSRGYAFVRYDNNFVSNLFIFFSFKFYEKT
jgi:RNA recognition motif-containing protein